MSLQYSTVVPSLMPRWRCDTCTVHKDGECPVKRQIWDALHRAQHVKAFNGSPEAVKTVFSAIEQVCQHSNHNAQPRPEVQYVPEEPNPSEYRNPVDQHGRVGH